MVALQFLSLAGVGVVWPYVNVYLTELDFSGTLIGTLGSGGALLSLVLTPLLNQIADRLMLHRRLLMFYLVGFALSCVIFATSEIRLMIILAVLMFRLTVSPSLTLAMQLASAGTRRFADDVSSDSQRQSYPGPDPLLRLIGFRSGESARGPALCIRRLSSALSGLARRLLCSA